MKILNFIPNFFTLANLFVGCVAVVYGVMGDLNTLAILVSIGLVCDFFDGFFARLLKVDSDIGVQLDSLSDLVTFGLTSSIVMMHLIRNSTFIIENSSVFYANQIPVIAFLITLASSYRLAKFNIGVKNLEFSGLPTPANAIFIVFLPFFIEKFELLILFKNIYFLIFIVLLSSYMLISNYPMMSLKLKNLNFNQNKILLIILLISLTLLIIYGFASLPIIIIIYILVNFIRLVF